MEKPVDKISINKKEVELFSQMLINLNRFFLKNKEHIKKYNHIRKLHSDIIDSMIKYLQGKDYDSHKYLDSILEDIDRETKGLDFNLTLDDADDASVLVDLFVYKNHHKIPSITEVYLKKKKFRNEEKVKLLKSMNNSYVGLFKVIAVNKEEGYVTYQDVFTHKRFKIIDISMSSTLIINKSNPVYIYNRVITFDGISFAMGIHSMMMGNHKGLKEFINKHKYNQCSDFSRCLLVYTLSKQNNKLKVTYHG